MPIPLKSSLLNTIVITAMVVFTLLILLFSGFVQFPSVTPSFHNPTTATTSTFDLTQNSTLNSSPDPFTDLLAAFKKWDSVVGCAKLREKYDNLGVNWSGPGSIQQFEGCQGLKLGHVSVLVKGWTWIPDNLDNLYSCRCDLSCLWTKSEVLADKPDALLFETTTPPVQGMVATGTEG